MEGRRDGFSSERAVWLTPHCALILIPSLQRTVSSSRVKQSCTGRRTWLVWDREEIQGSDGCLHVSSIVRGTRWQSQGQWGKATGKADFRKGFLWERAVRHIGKDGIISHNVPIIWSFNQRGPTGKNISNYEYNIEGYKSWPKVPSNCDSVFPDGILLRLLYTPPHTQTHTLSLYM